MREVRRLYFAGAAIVWLAVLVASALILGATPYFVPMFLVLCAAGVWFVIIVPWALFRDRQPSYDSDVEQQPAARLD